MIGGEHFRRYVAGPTARIVNVEGMEKLDQPLFLERRQAKRGGKKFDSLATKTAHEAQRDIEPKFEHAVERQKHSGTPRGLLVLHADMELARSIGDYQFPPVGIRSLGESRSESAGIEGGRDIGSGRRRFKEQRGR